MGYEKYYSGGWKSGEAGGTPITPEALNHMENGILNSAPAGYGYGGQALALSSALLRSEAELETVLEAVYGSMANSETKLIRFAGYPDNSDYNWFGILTKSSANYGSFFAHSSYNYGKMISKAKMGGTWRPLEWENPPMVAGVEYRTTERWNNKPVFTMLINGGAATNKMSITYPDEVTSKMAGVVRYAGKVGGAVVPSIGENSFTNAWTAHMNVGVGNAVVYCGSSLVGASVYLQIWYTRSDA
jgi:hypothetical protein